MRNARQVTAGTFVAEVLHSNLPVLVAFYASGCAPCRMMAPILDRVAAQVAGRAKVVKVNVDAAHRIADRYQVSSIPALVLIQQDKVVARAVGLTTAARIMEMIDRVAPQRRGSAPRR